MATVDAQNGSTQIEEITAATSDSTISGARELLLEYGRFIIAQPGTACFCFGSLEKEAACLPQSYHEQGGGCLVAKAQDALVGFVAWHTVPSTVQADAWEMRRLWVRPNGRGLGVGRALTCAVLDRASAAHRKAVCLETVLASMAAAHQLYLSLGFTPCPPYNDNPVDGVAYLVKYL